MEDLVAAETAARLAREQATPGSTAHLLTVAALRPGTYGILDVHVRMVAPARPYTGRSGRSGILQRVTLGDRTGEVVLVLWDGETRHVRDGTLAPGAVVRLRGATTEPGWKGGFELRLGTATVERVTHAAPSVALEGVLESVGPTRVVGEPPHVTFLADALLLTDAGRVRVVLAGEAVRDARSMLAGGRVVVTQAKPNPAMEGWWLAETGARVVPR